jgi:hypothetical protein
MESDMKNNSKPQINTPALTDINLIDLRSVTGGQKVASLPMSKTAARTCFCAKVS